MLINTIRKLFPILLLVTDSIAFYLIYYLITLLRTGEEGNFFGADQILFTMIACNAIALYFIGGYEYEKIQKSPRFVSEHFIASNLGGVFALFVILLFISYADRVGTNRTSLVGTFIVFSVYSIFLRTLIGHIKTKRKKNKCTIIVGSDEDTYGLMKEILDQGFQEKLYVVDGNIDASLVEKFTSVGVKVLDENDFDPKLSVCDDRIISRLVLAKSVNELNIDTKTKQALTNRHLQKNDVLFIETFFLSEFQYVPLKFINDSWPFKQGFRITKNVAYFHAKRTMDIILSMIVLVVTFPAMLIAMLAVKLTSKGPIFFKQNRIGEKEIPFTLLKLRTMKVGSDKKGDYTQENDPRITSIGNFLRKSRLDELPQLINVIKGDMSLIGPRAEWDKLVETYEKEIPHYHLRHISKPGITGWAQVNYPYGANLEDTINKLKYDLYYVRYYSLTMDLTIMIKTAYTMLFGRGR